MVLAILFGAIGGFGLACTWVEARDGNREGAMNSLTLATLALFIAFFQFFM